MRYKVIDSCPVPEPLYDELYAIKQRTGVVYTSIYRGTDVEPLLRKLGKQSQRQLYEGWINRRPGYNPANPPGYSTHELRSDGVAFPQWTRGARIPWYACGIDSTNASAIIREGSRRGWTVTLTYPSNPREQHHVNFRKAPRFKLFPVLKLGSRGPRVALLNRRLKRLGFRTKNSGVFSDATYLALRKFQRRWHQKDDGIYGIQTDRQLKAALRKKAQERKRKRRG